MRTTHELGLKITAAQREYYRYTGSSADAERRGAGFSHPERTWTGNNVATICASIQVQDRSDSGVRLPHCTPTP